MKAGDSRESVTQGSVSTLDKEVDMAEVPDHMVPTDGLTNSTLLLAGIDSLEGSGGSLRFDIRDETGVYVGTFTVDVRPQPEGTTDALIAKGHEMMRDVLRQWLHTTEMARRHYAHLTPKSTDAS